MCAIYGFLNYGNKIPHKTLLKIMRELSIAAECRGTDATGISYVRDNEIITFKKAKAAHKVQLFFPKDTTAVIGHNRMTTQGSETKNYNNHPFEGKTVSHAFALAHNGVLYNDAELKMMYKLPETKIETDSYVAVQFLEQYETVDCNTLREIMEIVMGSFVFTVLRDDNTLFLVRGNNPITLYHFPEYGLYIYASTKDILNAALKAAKFTMMYNEIAVNTGDIVRIDADGKLTVNKFDLCEPEMTRFNWDDWYRDYWMPEEGYTECDIMQLCGYYGIDREDVEYLLSAGYSVAEVEEMLVDTDYFEAALAEAKAYNSLL